jgi:hypothetical protein
MLGFSVLATAFLMCSSYRKAAASGGSGVVNTTRGVVNVPLAGPLADAESEISGLAWYREHLLILPQYPDRLDPGADGALFALPARRLADFVSNRDRSALRPVPIHLKAPGLRARIEGFQGYEAIAVKGDRVYLAIEAGGDGAPRGYVVAGTLSADLRELRIDTSKIAEIPLQVQLENMAAEAMILAGDQVITFGEVNGTALNPAPVGQVFSPDLAPGGTIPFPSLEYRVTDAGSPDRHGRFWVINYWYPGDVFLLPADQPGHAGPPATPRRPVERLVELQYAPSGIRRTETPLVELELAESPRNWEGIVHWPGKGFILATDRFPGTILGFVRYP